MSTPAAGSGAARVSPKPSRSAILGFAVLLYVAWRRRDLRGGYRYPAWLLGAGEVAWLLTLYPGWNATKGLRQL